MKSLLISGDNEFLFNKQIEKIEEKFGVYGPVEVTNLNYYYNEFAWSGNRVQKYSAIVKYYDKAPIF